MRNTTSIFAKTDPTPFIFALLACNVIASCILVCFYFARRTRFNITIQASPLVEFIITHICTPLPTMSSCSTAHTNILTTFTSGCFSQYSSFSNIFYASIWWTLTEIRIHVNIYIHFKSQILLKKLLWTECFNISFQEFNCTIKNFTLHAWNF